MYMDVDGKKYFVYDSFKNLDEANVHAYIAKKSNLFKYVAVRKFYDKYYVCVDGVTDKIDEPGLTGEKLRCDVGLLKKLEY